MTEARIVKGRVWFSNSSVIKIFDDREGNVELVINQKALNEGSKSNLKHLNHIWEGDRSIYIFIVNKKNKLLAIFKEGEENEGMPKFTPEQKLWNIKHRECDRSSCKECSRALDTVFEAFDEDYKNELLHCAKLFSAFDLKHNTK